MKHLRSTQSPVGDQGGLGGPGAQVVVAPVVVVPVEEWDFRPCDLKAPNK